jgi:hypothetical protein
MEIPEKEKHQEADPDLNKNKEEDILIIMAVNVQLFINSDQNRKFKINLPEFS